MSDRRAAAHHARRGRPSTTTAGGTEHQVADPPPPDLRGYLDVLRRRRWTVVLVVAVALALTVLVTLLQAPTYRATTELLFDRGAGEELFDPQTGLPTDAARDLQNEIEFIESDGVEAQVDAELANKADVEVTARDDADVVQIAATGEDPELAARTADTYARVALDLRRAAAIEDLDRSAEVVRTQLADVSDRVVRTQAELDSLDARLADDPGDSAAAAERNVVAERLATLDQERTSLQSTRRQVELSRELVRSGTATVTQRAEVPEDPVSPNPLLNLGLGLVLGLALGLALAFLRDRLDDSVRTKEDVERATGLPTLALVPRVSTWRDPSSARLISADEPTAPAAEAYRSLRASIDFVQLDRPLRIIGVTSSRSAEGKTTTCANLAVALARSGRRVLAVDCDLRRPRLHRFFDRPNVRGFTSVLVSDKLSEAVCDFPAFGRLALLPSGPIPPDPSELLASERAAWLFGRLEKHFDVILVDMPPVLPVSDALSLSATVDGMVVVSSATQTSARSLGRAVELLEQVGVPTIGVVLNEVGDDAGYGYEYGYDHLPTREARPEHAARS